MGGESPTPLQAGFLLTKREFRYVWIICAVALLGVAIRFMYLKNERAGECASGGIEKTEGN